MLDGEGRDNPKPRVTVKDLARELGMSVSTVSRAFYQDAVIAAKTRELVLRKAAEIGYQPNPLARSLITKRTRIVGIVVADITNPFYPEALTSLTDQLQANDFNVMLVVAGASRSVDDALRLLLSYQPDIAILLAASLSSEASAACRKAGTPLIFFNRYAADGHAFAVTCDNIQGGRMVADHLIDRGHRRLAFISGLGNVSTNVDRWEGFRSRCIERGLPPPLQGPPKAFSYEHGYASAVEMLSGGSRPDAIFCANDILAIGAMDAARRELGLRIPEDLSVVGFDGIKMASWPSHALTTVRQPLEKMLRLTLDIVLALSRDARLEPTIKHIPGEFIERNTTRFKDAD